MVLGPTEGRDYTRQLHAVIRDFLPTRGLPLIDKGRWSDRLLASVMLLMVFSAFTALQDRFADARAVVVKFYPSRRRPGKNYNGFIKQLRAHSPRLLALLVRTLRLRVRQRAAACWTVGRFLAFGVDGSKTDAPRTKANRTRLKIGGKHKSGPQQALVCVMHVGTGLLWSFRRGTAITSERELLRLQLGDLPAQSLLLMDAGFTGYDLLKTILAAGHQVLVRAGANLTLLKKLGWAAREKGDLVYLWPQKAQEQNLPPLVLRRIMLVDTRNRQICLLTSVRDDQSLSAKEAAELYRRRWGIELLYRGLKQTLGRRKMLSDTPENAGVELDWTLLGYWMLCLLLWEKRGVKAAASSGLAGALRLVRLAMAGRGDRRQNLVALLSRQRTDTYARRSMKASPGWPHKKNEPPCGVPELRTARRDEVLRAKRLIALYAVA
jgi:hypothetical protein